MTQQVALTDRAGQFRARIANPDRFMETCDGGDLGDPDSPAIWLLGLEPGWSVRDENDEQSRLTAVDRSFESYAVDLQLTWPFNRNAFKLLAALSGERPQSYADFARRERPFEQGAKGYFKGNLFAVACNAIGIWGEVHQLETGFTTKEEYRIWLRSVRFPILRERIERHRPKLIICTGLTHMADFMAVTATTDEPPAHVFEVNGHSKRIHVSRGGTVSRGNHSAPQWWYAQPEQLCSNRKDGPAHRTVFQAGLGWPSFATQKVPARTSRRSSRLVRFLAL